MAYNHKSSYESIWQKLKADGYCEVRAPVVIHARIKKAVTKRKDLDIAYKVLLEHEEHKIARLKFSKHKEDETIICMTLRKYVGINNL